MSGIASKAALSEASDPLFNRFVMTVSSGSVMVMKIGAG